jgi:hypothetical protein
MHGGVIEEAVDRLPPGDFRTRARLPAKKPSRLWRPGHLAHVLDALDEPGPVVSTGVAEIAVIDDKLIVETGTGQPHAPARERREACDPQHPVPIRGGLATATATATPTATADRVDMQVEPLPAAGRRKLRDHLFVGSPACSRLVAFHSLDQLVASLVPDLKARLIVQVTADAGEVKHGLYPDGGQLVGGPDTGPEQDRGASVGAAGKHHSRRPDFRQPLPVPHGHADRAATADKHPLDRRIAGHDEPVTDRIDVRERAVDPGDPVDVDREGRNAGILVEVVEVLDRGDPVRHDRIPEDALERGQLIETHPPNPQLAPRRCEQRQKFLCRPARIARGGPAVVIEAAPEHHRTGVVRGASADHARTVELDHLAAELARVAPVVGRLGDFRRVEKVVRPATAGGRPVVRPGLQQQRAVGTARREAAGNDRTRRSGADNDGVHFGGKGCHVRTLIAVSPDSGPDRCRTVSPARTAEEMKEVSAAGVREFLLLPGGRANSLVTRPHSGTTGQRHQARHEE